MRGDLEGQDTRGSCQCQKAGKCQRVSRLSWKADKVFRSHRLGGERKKRSRAGVGERRVTATGTGPSLYLDNQGALLSRLSKLSQSGLDLGRLRGLPGRGTLQKEKRLGAIFSNFSFVCGKTPDSEIKSQRR